jgi:hypothetical protein
MIPSLLDIFIPVLRIHNLAHYPLFERYDKGRITGEILQFTTALKNVKLESE